MRKEIKASDFQLNGDELVFYKTLPDGRRPDTVMADGEYEKLAKRLGIPAEELVLVHDVMTARARKKE